MTVPLGQTETDRANAALAHIGEPSIVSLNDAGRRAARECKKHFSEARDQLLRKANWQFAKASAQPASLGAPPDGVYLYRYPMPEDCVAVRTIRDAANETWEVRHAGNDGDPRVMVDTDIAAPLIFYTRRVVNPAQWDELFCEVFDLMLAAKINPLVGRDKGRTAELQSEADKKLLRAQQKDARERSPERITRDTSWISARRGYARRDPLKG
jgi:hypothetical protein